MEQVFRALCTDPTTGLPVDPRAIFMRLDTDGGGTVDIDEFRNGIEACGCELSKGILDLIYTKIHTYMHACMHTCIHTYTYIHTYVHAYTNCNFLSHS